MLNSVKINIIHTHTHRLMLSNGQHTLRSTFLLFIVTLLLYSFHDCIDCVALPWCKWQIIYIHHFLNKRKKEKRTNIPYICAHCKCRDIHIEPKHHKTSAIQSNIFIRLKFKIRMFAYQILLIWLLRYVFSRITGAVDPSNIAATFCLVNDAALRRILLINYFYKRGFINNFIETFFDICRSLLPALRPFIQHRFLRFSYYFFIDDQLMYAVKQL